VVAEPDDFAAWVEAQTQPSPVLRMAAASDTIDVPDTAAELAPDVAEEQDEALPEGIREGPDSVPGIEPAEPAEPAPDAAEPEPQDADLATILEDGQRLLMSKGCIACHRIQGTPAAGVLGPDLSHVGSRRTIAAGILENTTANMIRWLRNPGEVKPGALMPNLQLTDEELRTLAAYLRSLE
jgi:cytochrome c1